MEVAFSSLFASYHYADSLSQIYTISTLGNGTISSKQLRKAPFLEWPLFYTGIPCIPPDAVNKTIR